MICQKSGVAYNSSVQENSSRSPPCIAATASSVDFRPATEIRQTLAQKYKDEPFVYVLNEGQYPSTRYVTGTNVNVMTVSKGRTEDMVVITSVIDNLVKGASGQAVQNMNIMFGFDETDGLNFTPVYP